MVLFAKFHPPTKLPTHPNAKNLLSLVAGVNNPPSQRRSRWKKVSFFFARIPIIGTHLPTILPASSRDLCQGRKGSCLFSSKCGMGYFFPPSNSIIIFLSLFVVKTKTLFMVAKQRVQSPPRKREVPFGQLSLGDGGREEGGKEVLFWDQPRPFWRHRCKAEEKAISVAAPPPLPCNIRTVLNNFSPSKRKGKEERKKLRT